jgi:hypothetical protein
VGAGLALGNLSHNNTRRAITTEASSNGIGAFVGGELWVTRDWILGGEYHHQSANLSGTRAGTSASLGSSSWSRLDVFASYRYLPGETLDGTVLLFGGGYQSKNSNIPENATYNTAKKSYTGLLLRFDADIFLDLNNRFLVGVSLVPFSSADGLSSVTTLGFRFGWSINLTDVLWGRICFDYDSVTGTSGSGDDTRTDRRYAILPAIYFYF